MYWHIHFNNWSWTRKSISLLFCSWNSSIIKTNFVFKWNKCNLCYWNYAELVYILWIKRLETCICTVLYSSKHNNPYLRDCHHPKNTNRPLKKLASIRQSCHHKKDIGNQQDINISHNFIVHNGFKNKIQALIIIEALPIIYHYWCI